MTEGEVWIVWHVINSEDILEMLRRAHDGEDPDLLYIELYANGTPDDAA